jgi:LacI family transcriptional regulator
MTPSKAPKQTPKTVNLRTLAEYLNLSQTTVSLVLNNSPAARSIPEATHQRIREAARKLQYKPNYFARSLRSSRSLAIGILAPDLSEGYFTLVMNGVQQELLRAHYFYFTACHYWQHDLQQKYPRLLSDRSVDGFLLLNTQTEIKVQVPVVAISSHLNLPGVTNLCLDHERAAYLALEYLHSLGHRSIAFMRGPSLIPDSEYRWQGIEKAVAALGLKIQPELTIAIEETAISPEIGYQHTQELLARKQEFTAIFCFNDVAAIGAMRALDAAGLRVPEDVSVIGFDDIVSASYIRPSLTTVRQPLLEMGKRGAEVLLERIAEPTREFPLEITLQPELVIRRSTGPAAIKRG